MSDEICIYCHKAAKAGKQTLTRWYQGGEPVVAHWTCFKAVSKRCPQCNSETGVKAPRDHPIYCEDCGWPDEDFAEIMSAQEDRGHE